MAKTKKKLTTKVSSKNAKRIADEIVDGALARDVDDRNKIVKRVSDREIDGHYKHHRNYDESIKKAVSIVREYLFKCHELYPDHWVDPPYAENLEDHDIELINKIANAIHNARITRSW